MRFGLKEKVLSGEYRVSKLFRGAELSSECDNCYSETTNKEGLVVLINDRLVGSDSKIQSFVLCPECSQKLIEDLNDYCYEVTYDDVHPMNESTGETCIVHAKTQKEAERNFRYRNSNKVSSPQIAKMNKRRIKNEEALDKSY